MNLALQFCLLVFSCWHFEWWILGIALPSGIVLCFSRHLSKLVLVEMSKWIGMSKWIKSLIILWQVARNRIAMVSSQVRCIVNTWHFPMAIVMVGRRGEMPHIHELYSSIQLQPQYSLSTIVQARIISLSNKCICGWLTIKETILWRYRLIRFSLLIKWKIVIILYASSADPNLSG